MKKITAITTRDGIYTDRIVPDCIASAMVKELLDAEFINQVNIVENYEPGDEIVWVDTYEIPQLANVEIDYIGNYREGEAVMTKRLRAMGWEVICPWRDGERDSFGPLSRWSEWITPDCEVIRVIYG